MDAKSTESMYVIFSLPRCGSTALANILNIATSDGCAYEPFNVRRYAGRYNAAAIQCGIPFAVSMLRIKFKGFKHVWNESGWPFPSSQLGYNVELLRHKGFRVLLLSRRNILQRNVSEQLARQSGIWRTNTQELRTTRNSFPFSALDVDSLKEGLKQEKSRIQSIRNILVDSGNDWMEITFEDLFSNKTSGPESIVNVLKYLVGNGACIPTNQLKDIVTEESDVEDESRSAFAYKAVPNLADIEKLGSEDGGFLFDT